MALVEANPFEWEYDFGAEEIGVEYRAPGEFNPGL